LECERTVSGLIQNSQQILKKLILESLDSPRGWTTDNPNLHEQKAKNLSPSKGKAGLASQTHKYI
jgi:hypothetical protein